MHRGRGGRHQTSAPREFGFHPFRCSRLGKGKTSWLDDCRPSASYLPPDSTGGTLVGQPLTAMSSEECSRWTRPSWGRSATERSYTTASARRHAVVRASSTKRRNAGRLSVRISQSSSARTVASRRPMVMSEMAPSHVPSHIRPISPLASVSKRTRPLLSRIRASASLPSQNSVLPAVSVSSSSNSSRAVRSSYVNSTNSANFFRSPALMG